MSIGDEIQDILEHKEEITVGITTAISIVKYGLELYDLVVEDKLSDEELEELVLTYSGNMNTAIEKMNASIAARKSE